MLLNLHTGYVTSDGALVLAPNRIRARYLRRSLWYDTRAGSPIVRGNPLLRASVLARSQVRRALRAPAPVRHRPRAHAPPVPPRRRRARRAQGLPPAQEDPAGHDRRDRARLGRWKVPALGSVARSQKQLGRVLPHVPRIISIVKLINRAKFVKWFKLGKLAHGVRIMRMGYHRLKLWRHNLLHGRRGERKKRDDADDADDADGQPRAGDGDGASPRARRRRARRGPRAAAAAQVGDAWSRAPARRTSSTRDASDRASPFAARTAAGGARARRDSNQLKPPSDLGPTAGDEGGRSDRAAAKCGDRNPQGDPPGAEDFSRHSTSRFPRAVSRAPFTVQRVRAPWAVPPRRRRERDDARHTRAYTQHRPDARKRRARQTKKQDDGAEATS